MNPKSHISEIAQACNGLAYMVQRSELRASNLHVRNEQAQQMPFAKKDLRQLRSGAFHLYPSRLAYSLVTTPISATTLANLYQSFADPVTIQVFVEDLKATGLISIALIPLLLFSSAFRRSGFKASS